MRMPRPREQQPQVIVNLRNRPHRRARIMRHALLIYGNRRRKPLDIIHIRLIHPPQELPSIRRQRLHIPPLPLRINRIERQGTLARPRNPRHHHQLIARNRNAHILQIMLPRPLNNDILQRHTSRPLSRNSRNLRNPNSSTQTRITVRLPQPISNLILLGL